MLYRVFPCYIIFDSQDCVHVWHHLMIMRVASFSSLRQHLVPTQLKATAPGDLHAGGSLVSSSHGLPPWRQPQAAVCWNLGLLQSLGCAKRWREVAEGSSTRGSLVGVEYGDTSSRT